MSASTRISQLKAEAATLRRDLNAAVIDQDDARVTSISAALRQNQDTQDALVLIRDTEAHRRPRLEAHREAHEALDLLMESLERRRALAADVDRATAALRQSLAAFRSSCTEAHQHARSACAAGFRSAPVHFRTDATPQVEAAVSMTEGKVLDAFATVVNQLFEMQTPEGQHLWHQVEESLRNGSGYYLNTVHVWTFSGATDALHQRMPDVLQKLYRYMATEAESLGAATAARAL